MDHQNLNVLIGSSNLISQGFGPRFDWVFEVLEALGLHGGVARAAGSKDWNIVHFARGDGNGF